MPLPYILWLLAIWIFCSGQNCFGPLYKSKFIGFPHFELCTVFLVTSLVVQFTNIRKTVIFGNSLEETVWKFLRRNFKLLSLCQSTNFFLTNPHLSFLFWPDLLYSAYSSLNNGDWLLFCSGVALKITRTS